MRRSEYPRKRSSSEIGVRTWLYSLDEERDVREHAASIDNRGWLLQVSQIKRAFMRGLLASGDGLQALVQDPSIIVDRTHGAMWASAGFQPTAPAALPLCSCAAMSGVMLRPCRRHRPPTIRQGVMPCLTVKSAAKSTSCVMRCGRGACPTR